ncbi:MAG: Ni/Fe hydrogenase subunit alpha [Leptothrix sp. (in: b-proteobacteria)]
MNLETAAHPEGLRRVVIDPVSRVEGHGKVTLLLDEQGVVQQARLHIVEFRGFERFIEGRPYWEVPVMVQRLCGICPVSHHLAANKAIDAALGLAGRLPPLAETLRRLMHYGQIFQSHALHFFHLSSPDLLFGFDAEPTRRNIMAVAKEHPEVARQGVLLRRFGQQVIELTAGKRIHGTGAIPGGVNLRPERAACQALLAEVPQLLAWAEGAVDLVQRLHESDPALYDHFADVPAAMLSLVAPDGAMDLYDGALRWRDASGQLLLDQVPVASYLDVIDEEVRPWSYMKFPHLRSLGPDDGWYRVGPLARLQNVDRIPTLLAEARRQVFRARWGQPVVHAVLATHWARMIEMLHSLEVVADLLNQLVNDAPLLAGALSVPLPRAEPGSPDREGVGIIEAPRGTLIHHYRIGADDLITQCNLIVSTTHNNQAMNEAVRSVAAEYFDGRELTEGLLNRIEVAIRAYDPCLSCATHAIGQMPLEVNLQAADGSLRDQLWRHSDGRIERAVRR